MAWILKTKPLTFASSGVTVRSSAPCAWGGGALFLLHPTHAEVVNYISSRSDLLVSFFYLAALLLAFKERERIVPGTHFAYIAGLLSKSVAFTLPLIVGGYRVWRWGWRQQVSR